MWTSCSSDHASEHHPPLANQPDVVVAAILGLYGPYAEDQATAAPDVDRQPADAPLLNRATRAHGARPTGQGFTLDPAFIGPHPPAGLVLRDEVDVGAI